MRHLLIILTLLFSINSFAQLTAIVADNHPISVDDTLSKYTVERYDFYLKTNPINYEDDIRQIKAVKMVQGDRYYVGELKEGIIYLNNKLDSLPNTKRIMILQYLAANNGMELKQGYNPHVRNQGFNMTERNEDMFRRQFIRHTPYLFIVKELREVSPLKLQF